MSDRARRLTSMLGARPAPAQRPGVVQSISGRVAQVEMGGQIVPVVVPDSVGGVTEGVTVMVAGQGRTLVATAARDAWGATVPVGGVIEWPSAVSVPAGWLLCAGGTYSSGTYPRLYAVLGTTTLPAPTARTGLVSIIRAT